MQLRRKRALVVAGGLATLLGGAGLSGATAAGCPVNLICAPIVTAAEDLGILPDPTRTILQDIYSQMIFPDEAAPVYTQLNATLAPAEPVVFSATSQALTIENQVSGTVTPRIQEIVELTGADVPVIYGDGACVSGPKHEGRDHKNHKHCEA